MPFFGSAMPGAFIVSPPSSWRQAERKTANPLGLAVSLYLLVVMGRIELPTYGL